MVQTILSFLLILTSVISKAADSTYLITGKLDDIKSGVIYVNIYGEEEKQESAKVIDGIFMFKGFLQQPVQAVLSIKGKPDYFTFYIEPGTINISGRASSLKELVVSNSPLNEDDKFLQHLDFPCDKGHTNLPKNLPIHTSPLKKKDSLIFPLEWLA